MSAASNHKHSFRKWSGVILIVIEVNLVSGTIFGFPALFQVLPNYGIYGKYCTSPIVINSTMVTETDCDGQTKQYQVCQRCSLISLWVYCRFVECINLGAYLVQFNVCVHRCSQRRIWRSFYQTNWNVSIALLSPSDLEHDHIFHLIFQESSTWSDG
jgi:hypothetical protein